MGGGGLHDEGVLDEVREDVAVEAVAGGGVEGAGGGAAGGVDVDLGWIVSWAVGVV